MIYFKSVLIGLGAVLSGCVVTPIAMLIWASWQKTGGGEITISFSPMGLTRFVGFWVFIAVLFAVGFVPSLFLLRR